MLRAYVFAVENRVEATLLTVALNLDERDAVAGRTMGGFHNKIWEEAASVR